MLSWNRSLPLEIILEIRNYLHEIEYLLLLNTSQVLFVELKRKTRKIYLYDEDLENYQTSIEFRSFINDKIDNPSEQLIFVYNNKPDWRVFDQFLNFPAYRICFLDHFELHDFSNWESRLCKYHSITLTEESEIKEFKCLRGVQRISLNGLVNLTNIQLLSSLTEVKLSNCDLLSDISCLKNITKLSIEVCPKIKDVSTLGSIPNLSIILCTGIEDVSALCNNQNLTLCMCHNIKKETTINCFQRPMTISTDLIHDNQDISLINPFVRNLSLFNFQEETFSPPDSDYFHALKDITFYAADITAMSSKQNYKYLHRLTLFSCDEITSLRDFPPVTVLNLFKCQNLVDISSLAETYYHGQESESILSDSPVHSGSYRTVSLFECGKIRDFSSLCDFYCVRIDNCQFFRNTAKCVKNVKQLEIANCNQLLEIKGLSENIQSVELVDCHEIENLSGLGHVPRISIRNCEQITSLSGLHGGNQRVEIEEGIFNHLLRKSKESSSISFPFHLYQVAGRRRVNNTEMITLLKKQNIS